MDELVERLRAEGLDPSPWSNGPGDRYEAHEHGYDKVIVGARGSIVFRTAAGDVSLGVGERLELPARTSHAAMVGPDGVTCLEAHLPAGRLPALRRRDAGAW